MALFSGLYPFEVVLLLLGILLFLACLFGLIYQILRGEKYGALVPIFGISVAMIAYPSIQQVEFKDGVVTITKQTEALQQNPTDASARAQLQQSVSKWNARISGGPENASALASLATAQYALDDQTAAKANLQKALAANPATPAAVALRQKMSAVQNLDRLTAIAREQPANQKVASMLRDAMQAASTTPVANPTALATISQAQAALGDRQAATETAQKAIAIKPSLARIPQLSELAR